MLPESEAKLTRRQFLQKGRSLLAALLTAPPAAYLYARFTEPYFLQIKRVPLTLPRLPDAFSGFRVLQFSDVHLGFHFPLKRLQRLVAHMNELGPDLVVFTGDLFDSKLFDEVAHSQALEQLKAPFGKLAVLGNHDYYDAADRTADVLTEGGFTVLRNAAVPLTRGTSRLWIAGVEDAWEGKPQLAKALAPTPADACRLLLSHAPDLADQAAGHGIDLQLSGHSHGGQVRLPFYGPVVTPPPFGRKYVMGHYQLPGGLQLYTNRGLGTSMQPYRFFCRPELTLFTLHAPSGG
ncbi:metallophosphoesterase [Paenibacillus sp. J31TS4]|uniref:metallophosphoesterase n=1 Tax=Paenibacillus sp. J31TS4 TaxID=2807195 RepID=UPI001B0811C9|nr:metallophosphoesterase [Paenibacillus sp. J31TS4]GIP38728.1 metallophosphoesterase [Paenibacillus sp. J31TS4]